MTDREIEHARYLINTNGEECGGARKWGYDSCGSCPYEYLCGNGPDIEVAKEAKRRLSREWQPLEKDNLPPDILTWKIKGNKATHEIVADRRCAKGQDVVSYDIIEFIGDEFIKADGWEYRYRLRKPSPPSHEELAEAYAHDVYENAPPAFDFQRYIKQAYIDGRKSMENEDD